MTGNTGRSIVRKPMRASSVAFENRAEKVNVAEVAPENGYQSQEPEIITPKTITSLADLTLDPRNANRGTERGAQMIEESFRHLGAGRSILIDKHGQVIAGNKSVEACASIGLDDVIVVPSDGTKLIAVQRTDLDLNTDPMAKALAIADNRTQQIDLEWDAGVLDQLAKEIDLSPFFNEEELGEVLSETERLKEVEKELKPKQFVRVLISIPIDHAGEAKEFLDQLALVPEIEIDYAAN